MCGTLISRRCVSLSWYKTVKQREEKYNYRELPRTPVSARSNTSGCLSLWRFIGTRLLFSLEVSQVAKVYLKVRRPWLLTTGWRRFRSNRWIIKERLLKLCAFKLFISFYKQIKLDSSVKWWACLPLSHPGQQFQTKCIGWSRTAMHKW